MKAKTPLTIIIPAYNEANTVGETLECLKPYVDIYGFEVIVVNDGSSDNTAEVVEKFDYIKLLNQPYNKGYGAALKTGVRKATYEWVLTMDSDGQHQPEDIPKLIEDMEDFDMVVGRRKLGVAHEWIRKPGKWILRRVAEYLTNMKIPDINSGFKLIRKNCVEEFMHILPNGYSFSTTITLAMIKAGYNIKFVQINNNRRKGGISEVRQLRDGFATILLITRCISLFNPLKIYAPIAVAILAFSILFSLCGIIFFGNFPRSGVVSFLSGILILLFGILADQIASIRKGNN